MKIMLMVLGLNFMFFNMMNGQTCLSPGSPTTGLITPSTAEMNWNSIPGADGYELEYRVLNALATVPWNTVTAGTNSTTLTGLTANTVYLAQIRTVCGSNFSDYTGKVVFSTAVCVPASGLNAINITQTTADLNWTPANGASGYKLLWRKLNSTQAPDPWNSDITGNSMLGITGLTASSLYETRILTDCGGTWSDTSNAVFFSTAGCSVPANLVVTEMNAGSITLQWSAVPGATQYNIDYREMGTFTWNTVNSNTNDKMIHGLTDNTQYELRVRSRCGGNNFSDYTLPINGYTLPCGMPVNAIVTAVSVDQATINWNNATGANNYRVDYRETGSPTWNTVNANNTTKKLNNLNPDTEYQVRIRSKCSGNQYSAYTDTLVFRTEACGNPGILSVDSAGYHYARLKWNAAANATRYNLQYKAIGDTLWTQITLNDTIRGIRNLTPGVNYMARVRSQCGNGGVYSDFSNEVLFGGYGCFTPIDLTIDSTSYTTANLHWDYVSFATQYRIEYKPVQDSVWQTDQTQNTNIRLNQLSEGTTYQLRMRSKCPQNEFSSYSDTILFSTNGCAVPYNVYSNINSFTSVTIGWDSIPNSQGYQLEYKPESDSIWERRNTNVPNRTINGLDKNLTYDFRVRNKCEQGVFSGYTQNFKIWTGSCGMPANFTADSIAPNTVRLAWISTGNGNTFQIRYKSQNDSIWITTTTAGNQIDITGLDLTEKDYEFALAGPCGENGFSREQKREVPIDPVKPAGCDLMVPDVEINVCPGKRQICAGSMTSESRILYGIYTWEPDNPVSAQSHVSPCRWMNVTESITYTVTGYATLQDPIDGHITVCTATGTVTVNVLPAPNLIVNCPETVCNGSNASVVVTCTECALEDVVTVSRFGASNTTTYGKIVADGNIVDVPVYIANLNPDFPQSIPFTVTVTNANNCKSTVTCGLTPTQAPPPFVIQSSEITTIPGCNPTFQRNLNVPDFGAGYTYSWTLNGVPLTPSNSNFKHEACFNPGDNICVTITAPFSPSGDTPCSRTVCHKIPTATCIQNVTPLDFHICSPNETRFCFNNLLGADSYNWSICGRTVTTNSNCIDIADLREWLTDISCEITCTPIVGEVPQPGCTYLLNDFAHINPIPFVCPVNRASLLLAIPLFDADGNHVITRTEVATIAGSGGFYDVEQIIFNNDFIVDVPITFSGIKLDMRGGARIIVTNFNNTLIPSIERPELSMGNLTLLNCHIHNSTSQNVWGGIILQPGTDVSLRTPQFIAHVSVIEHAITGLFADADNGTIGAIDIEGCCFNENVRHVIAANYQGRSLDWFNFNNNELNCIGNLKDNPEHYSKTYIGITGKGNITHEIGGTFTSSRFYDPSQPTYGPPNLFRNMQIGIFVDGATCGVYNNDFSDFTDADQIATPTSIEDRVGVYITGLESKIASCILGIFDQIGNTFMGNTMDYGVYVEKYSSLVNFYKNDFQKTGGTYSFKGIGLNNLRMIPGLGSQIKITGDNIFSNCFRGISLSSIPVALDVDGNSANDDGPIVIDIGDDDPLRLTNFQNCITGVYIDQQRVFPNFVTVRGAKFTDNRTGIFANRSIASTPYNSSKGDPYLAIERNDFVTASADQNKHLNGVNINGNFCSIFNGIIATYADIIDNDFNQAESSNYYSNAAINITSSRGINLEANRITGNGFLQQGLLFDQSLATLPTNNQAGIRCTSATDGIVNCNYIRNVDYGFDAWNDNQGTLLNTNTFSRVSTGIGLSNDQASLFTQGDANSCLFNIWSASQSLYATFARNSADGRNTSFSWALLPLALSNWQTRGINGSFNAIPIPPFVQASDILSPAVCNNTGRTNNYSTFIAKKKFANLNDKVASGSLNYNQFPLESDYIAQKNLLETMMDPKKRETASAIVDSFCNAKAGSTMHKLLVVDRLISQNLTQAQTLNESITPHNKVEEAYTRMNHILIKYNQNPVLSTTDLLEVNRLSELCPAQFGPAVYQARSLRTTLEREPRSYVDECIQDDLLRKPNSDAEVFAIKLSPNPSKGNFTIQYDFSGASSARLEMFSISGQKLWFQDMDVHKTEELVSWLNVVAGVYVCKFIVDNKHISSQKLVIVE